MTREELREKVARALCYSDGGDKTDPDAVAYYYEHADAAIALVLEEAAKVAEMMGGTVRQGNIAALYIPPTAKDAAAAIRALKEK